MQVKNKQIHNNITCSLVIVLVHKTCRNMKNMKKGTLMINDNYLPDSFMISSLILPTTSFVGNSESIFLVGIGIIQEVLGLVGSETVGDSLWIVSQRLSICAGEKSIHLPILGSERARMYP